MRTFYYFGIIAVLSAYSLSCTNSSTELVVDDLKNKQLLSSERSINDSIAFTGELFQFKDVQTLYRSAITYQSDGGSLKKWVNSHNILTLKDVYDQVIKEEAFFHQNPEMITQSRKETFLTKGYLSDFAAQYQDIITTSKEEGTSINIAYPSLAAFLTPKGFVKINDKIYQFTNKQIKIIEDGNTQKMSQLNNTNNTNASLGITVINIKNIAVNRKNGYSTSQINYGTTYGRSAENCQGNPCEFRVIGYENFTYQGNNQYVHTTTLRNLKRGFLGYWYDNNANNETGNINGKLNFLPVTSPTTPLPNSIYPYNVTGYGATVSASYSFTLPEPYNFYVDSSFWFTCPSVAVHLD